MKRLTDVNVLLALATDRSRQHAAVRAWWERLPSTDHCARIFSIFRFISWTAGSD